MKLMCWVDIETTGLDPELDDMLEIACVITDQTPQFNMIATYHDVVRWTESNPPSMWNGVVLNMHNLSGLMEECKSTERTESNLATPLSNFLSDTLSANDAENYTLAGASVEFDRSFLENIIEPDKFFHYRLFNTSTFKTVATILDMGINHFKFEPEHRAMTDIMGAIELAKFFIGIAEGYKQMKDLLEEEWSETPHKIKVLRDKLGTPGSHNFAD
jgi:oligoribonuclease